MKPINIAIADEEELVIIKTALEGIEGALNGRLAIICSGLQKRLESEESKDPFCANCKEDHCEVSEDGTCKMIRVYLENICSGC